MEKRPPPNPGVIRARLDGAARRLLREDTPTPDAIAELLKISSDPTLLGLAAGTALGAWQVDDKMGWQGDEVAALLLQAGASPEVTERSAAEVKARRDVERGRGGIGNP